MTYSTLTKRIEFSASHRYYQKAWDEATNRQVFGPCVQEHGHNYLLEVTLGGQVDGITGMIINLYDLKTIVNKVLEEFDHKHLNLDTPYFAKDIPTTENLALVLWRKFRKLQETKNIFKLTLSEAPDLWAEILTPKGPPHGKEPTEATVSRRYHFPLVHRSQSGKPAVWHLSLTIRVRGPIDPMTGRVTDITTLDERVCQQVIQPFSGQDLSLDPLWGQKSLTPGKFLQTIWPKISPLSGGKLDRLFLQDHSQTVVEYAPSKQQGA